MKLTLIAAMSADGKIAEREGQTSLDWTSEEDTKFFKDKTKEIGCVIMGRKTFDTIGRALPGRLNVVMTRSLEGKPHEDGVLEFTDMAPKELVADLEKRGVEAAAVIGGADVYRQFLVEGLVNELYLSVEPVLFGGGIPLAEGFPRTELKLIDVSRLGEKTVLLHYAA